MKISLLISILITGLVTLFSMAAHADGVDEPIPSFYQEPGISPNRQYVSQHANEHIDPFTGKLQWHYTDLFIPGNGGLDLAVQRSYTSQDLKYPEASPAGFGWTMHFGRVMRTSSYGTGICHFGLRPGLNPVLELPDGSRQILYEGLDGMSFITTNFWKAVCNTSSGTLGLTVFSPEGIRYDMTTPGAPLGGDTPYPVNTYYVSKITDRNGNWMSFSYAFVGISFGVTSISTSDGREVTFTYKDGMISAITDGVRTWNYLSSENFLTEVKRPDGASWKYSYNPLAPGNSGHASLNSVTYPAGGTISYSYDLVYFSFNIDIPPSVVVNKKIADGATWGYSYKPATLPLPGDVALWTDFPDEKVDITTVAGPDGTRIYKHIGYTSVPSGGVMHIGQPVSVATGITQFEAYSHTFQLISNQQNRRPGDTLTLDMATYASILLGKGINKNGQAYQSSFTSLDEFGNPVEIIETGTDQRKTTTSYEIDKNKWILHLKKDESSDINGVAVGSITRSFDSNRNLLSENRYGVKTDFTYTSTGDLASRTDARNNTISYSDYHRGIPRKEIHPEGVTISRTVSDAGNVMSQTDGESATINYKFDELNRVTKITPPSGNPVDVVWTINDRTTTRGGYKEVVTLDAFGREAQIVHSGAGPSISTTNKYDAVGRRIFTSYPNSEIGTNYLYDTAGQLLRVGNAFNPATETAGGWRTYNRAYNVLTFINERGMSFKQTYRGFSDPDQQELISVAAPEASASIEMKRNGLGQVTEAKQDGKIRTYVYDSRYFMTSQNNPETAETVYGRDEVGNMTSSKVGASLATSYSYDGRNRLSAVFYPDSTSVQRTYYRDDKVQSIDNGIAARNYVYDANKNLTRESLSIAGENFPIQYTYDSNDALSMLTYGSGQTVTYNPDAFGRPTQALPYVTSVTHHPSGVISSMLYANGVQTNVGLNARLWPSTLKISKGTSIFDKNYFYDSIGNVVAIDDTAIDSYPRMTYDNIDRLITATGPWSGSYNASYDGRGNIKRQGWKNGTVEYFSRAYNYDAANDRLLSVSETSGTTSTPYDYTYDTYGNVIGKGATTFKYNEASAMRCSNCETPAESLYDYDGANMRVRLQKNGVTTYFVYGLAGNLLWEQTPGENIKEYFYLGGKQIATHEKPSIAQ